MSPATAKIGNDEKKSGFQIVDQAALGACTCWEGRLDERGGPLHSFASRPRSNASTAASSGFRRSMAPLQHASRLST